MAATKASVKPVAAAASQVEAEATEGLIEVTNITDKTICLANGFIESGKNGRATPAELSTLWQHIKKV